MLSETELAALRVEATIAQGEPPNAVFTCDDCGARFNCPYVFDWYNTDGDCLAEK